MNLPATAVVPFQLVYQVFPDRFARAAGGRPRVEPEPGHHGGDLFGLAERAGYLADLGVDAVYLNPIHPAPSYHRYDATDYRAVAPALGGMAGFEAMLEALHGRGIRVILDLVLNHASDRHPRFLQALADPASPARAWFRFRADGSYDCWRDHPELPEWNLEHGPVLEDLVTGPDSVLRFWIGRGVDGFRLDCANDLGIQLCRRVLDTARTCRAGLFILGETFHWGADWLQGLDGLQSYVLTGSIRDLLTGRLDGRQFGLNLTGLYRAALPHGGLHRSWNMLSSHDIPRVLSSLDGDLRRLELALLLQFTAPGTPIIYYGDENGMAGGADPLNRAPMVWDPGQWRLEIRALYQRMIALRRERPELRDGAFEDLSDWAANGTVAFLRTGADPRAFALVCVNPTGERRTFPLYAPASRMFADLAMRDLLSGRTVNTGAGCLEIDQPPLSGAVYVPEYHLDRYDFAKRL